VALTRAAQHERQQLEAHRGRLVDRALTVEHELAALRSELVHVDGRIRLLDALLETSQSAASPVVAADFSPVVLRGAQLREQAARVLAEKVGVRTQVQYRDWFRWMEEAGFVVLGKRPRATFLTSVRRSPVTRAGDEPGTYWLDPAAPHRLATELSELQGELNDLDSVLHREPKPNPSLVTHRKALLANIRRVKRELAEAESILATPRSISAVRRTREIA
jgi:hypothetical protein